MCYNVEDWLSKALLMDKHPPPTPKVPRGGLAVKSPLDE